jgi:hypothetical protein
MWWAHRGRNGVMPNAIDSTTLFPELAGFTCARFSPTAIIVHRGCPPCSLASTSVPMTRQSPDSARHPRCIVTSHLDTEMQRYHSTQRHRDRHITGAWKTKDTIMKSVKRFFMTLLLALSSSTVSAIPVTYHVEFTPTAGYIETTTWGPSGELIARVLESAVGRSYFGSFAVDSDLLLSDGLGKYGELEYFHLQMEWNVWAYNLPTNNSLTGFRGQYADGSCPSGACLGGASPGLDVVNGELVGLRGGVYGTGDVPFVDFRGDTFGAMGHTPIQPGQTTSHVGSYTQPESPWIQGTMKIFRVPEASTVVPFSLGLLPLVLIGFARRQRTWHGIAQSGCKRQTSSDASTNRTRIYGSRSKTAES